MALAQRAWILVLSVGLAALPAQSRKSDKGSSEKGDTSTLEKVKDDKMTAKDKAIVAIDKFTKKKVSTKRKNWKSSMAAPPELSFTTDRAYFWLVETDKGAMKIQLFPDAAPKHCASTIYLSRAGFYDGLTLPRVLKGFMAQGGSPLNTTSGSAGYTLDHEFADDRLHDAPGTLSAANAGRPNTDSSQFFLTFVPTPHLDGKHTVYGRVVEGLETLKQIEACGVELAQDGTKLEHEPVMLRTWITVAEVEAAADGAGGDAGKDPKKGSNGK